MEKKRTLPGRTSRVVDQGKCVQAHTGTAVGHLRKSVRAKQRQPLGGRRKVRYGERRQIGLSAMDTGRRVPAPRNISGGIFIGTGEPRKGRNRGCLRFRHRVRLRRKQAETRRSHLHNKQRDQCAGNKKTEETAADHVAETSARKMNAP